MHDRYVEMCHAVDNYRLGTNYVYWAPLKYTVTVSSGKSSEPVQFGMLKACDACADMAQL